VRSLPGLQRSSRPPELFVATPSSTANVTVRKIHEIPTHPRFSKLWEMPSARRNFQTQFATLSTTCQKHLPESLDTPLNSNRKDCSMTESRSAQPVENVIETPESRGADLAFVRPNHPSLTHNPRAMSACVCTTRKILASCDPRPISPIPKTSRQPPQKTHGWPDRMSQTFLACVTSAPPQRTTPVQ
jgi:hypothetical protein